jgi:hypothetical protein
MRDVGVIESESAFSSGYQCQCCKKKSTQRLSASTQQRAAAHLQPEHQASGWAKAVEAGLWPE